MERERNKKWSGDRFEKQKADRTRLLEGWKKSRQAQADKHTHAKESKPQADAQKTCSDEVLTDTIKPPTFPLYGNANIYLFKDNEDAAHVPSAALERVVNLYLESAETGSAHLILMWPGAIRTIPLVHTFATMEHWAYGNKKGLRGCYFPAKNNTFYGLNHIYIDQTRILHWAKELMEPAGEQNSRVIVPLREKDAVFFRIGNTTELRPCVNEIIPHFEKLVPAQSWEHYGDGLIEHVIAKLKRRNQKQALRSNLETLGDPKSAPDALFAIGYRLNKKEIRDTLISLKKIGLPKVFVVDATRPIRMKIENWRGKVNGFIEAFLDAFKTGKRPGLLIITDDPGIGWQLRDVVDQKNKKTATAEPLQLRFAPIVCFRNDEGLRGVEEPEPEAPVPRKFFALIRDSEASKVIGRINRISQNLSLDIESLRPLKAAANYLHKLSALPSSVAILNKWLDERQADIRFRDQFSWASYRGNLIQFIGSGSAGQQKGELEKTLELADRVVRAYFNGTTIAQTMFTKVAAAANSPKHISVVFTKPMLRTLAERFLSEAEYDHGKRFEDFRERVRLLLTSQLQDELETEWTSRFVFIGVDDEVLRLMLSDNRIPAESTILLTYRAAIYMRSMLKHIYAIDEFRRFKPRIENILHQLAQQLNAEERSVMLNEDFVLPSLNFNEASISKEPDIADANAWHIELDDGQLLARGEASLVYIYDPANEESGQMGFRQVEAGSLKKGDRLFVMSEDLRELVEDILKRADIPIRHDLQFETNLRQYHELVMRKLAERFPLPTQKAQVEAIREYILQHHAEITDLPVSIGRWISLGETPNKSFDELRPQAPRKQEHFKAFAEALGFEETQIVWYWLTAIESIRVNRRIDGRYISDIYSKVLLGSESVIVHAGLSRKATVELYEKARDNVYVVEEIHPPAEVMKEPT